MSHARFSQDCKSTSQSRTVLSIARRGEALAVGAEGDARHPALMALERCAEGLCRSRHPRAARSCPQLAEARRLPSGLKATLVTSPCMALERLRRGAGRSRRPRAARSCHSSPRRGVLPSGLKATLVTPPSMALERSPRGWPARRRPRAVTVLSQLAEARRLAVGAEGDARSRRLHGP